MSAPKDTAAAAREDDEECPALEEADAPVIPAEMAARVQEAMAGAKQPKKYAKAMQRLGLKPEENILRVQIRKGQGINFAIARPEVYRFPSTNTFVIFGETQLEDSKSNAQRAAALAATAQAAAAPEVKAAPVEEETEEEVDASGLEEKEIDIVMSQASVPRAKAVKALKNNKGDIVNAIMELTM